MSFNPIFSPIHHAFNIRLIEQKTRQDERKNPKRGNTASTNPTKTQNEQKENTKNKMQYVKTSKYSNKDKIIFWRHFYEAYCWIFRG